MISDRVVNVLAGKLPFKVFSTSACQTAYGVGRTKGDNPPKLNVHRPKHQQGGKNEDREKQPAS
jgi:hypothetical protein